RYTPPGEQVVVEFGENPPSLRVCDSGPGVPRDEQERIFERFVRGSGALGTGSGLGLAIVRDIATLHGAQVHAFHSPQGGLCVEIRLPGPPAESSLQG
ncbi:MAG: HAMP domain-containing histidine kinase, partial [Rhizobacter sp.]|nr:HAMP domain-containing histidine kinase [Rhizobacter sp.]